MAAEWAAQPGADGPQLRDWLQLGICTFVGPLAVCTAALARRCQRAYAPVSKEPAPAKAAAGPPVRLVDTGKIRRVASDPLPVSLSATLEPELPGAGWRTSLRDVGPFQRASGRVLYYDFWRSICVTMVVITHATEEYARWNVGGVQQWVLQVLTLISGSLFAKSRRPFLEYQARFLALFSAGVALNALSAMAAGIKWHGERFGDVVMFQMSFLLLFISGAVVVLPLKWQLAPGAKPRAALVSILLYTGSLAAAAAVQMGLWQAGVTAWDQCVRIVAQVFVTALLAAVLARGHTRVLQHAAGWVMAVWIFGTRVAHREEKPGSDVHLVNLYVWAAVVQWLPLLGQRRLGRAMAQLWPLWALVCGLLLKPGVYRRVDRYPHDTPYLRLRQYLPELVCVLAFTAIPSAGMGATLPLASFVAPHTAWVSRWSLLAFASHQAIYYLVPALPYGIFLVFLTMPAFYCASGRPVAACGRRAA